MLGVDERRLAQSRIKIFNSANTKQDHMFVRGVCFQNNSFITFILNSFIFRTRFIAAFIRDRSVWRNKAFMQRGSVFILRARFTFRGVNPGGDGGDASPPIIYRSSPPIIYCTLQNCFSYPAKIVKLSQRKIMTEKSESISMKTFFFFFFFVLETT